MLKELLQHAAASDQDIVSTKGEIETCRAELERLWAEDDGLGAEYELASVFIHLGAAGFGHYYLHQRALPSQPERWLKFNDSTVGVCASPRGILVQGAALNKACYLPNRRSRTYPAQKSLPIPRARLPIRTGCHTCARPTSAGTSMLSAAPLKSESPGSTQNRIARTQH